MSAGIFQREIDEKRFISKRNVRNAYRHAFLSAEGKIVLADLARRCFVGQSTFQWNDPDGRISAFNDGHRCVFELIQKTIRLTDAEVREIAEENPT